MAAAPPGERILAQSLSEDAFVKLIVNQAGGVVLSRPLNLLLVLAMLLVVTTSAGVVAAESGAEPAAIQDGAHRTARNAFGTRSPTAIQPLGADVAPGAAESCW